MDCALGLLADKHNRLRSLIVDLGGHEADRIGVPIVVINNLAHNTSGISGV